MFKAISKFVTKSIIANPLVAENFKEDILYILWEIEVSSYDVIGRDDY